MPTRSTTTKKEPDHPFLQGWSPFSEFIQDFIIKLTGRKSYSLAAYFEDLASVIETLAETSNPWFADSKANWILVADGLKKEAKNLGADLDHAVPIGELNRGFSHYVFALERLLRKVQGYVEGNHTDWYKSPDGQPIAVVEIVKILRILSKTLCDESNPGEVFLLRPQDRRWAVPAYSFFRKTEVKMGGDPIFNTNAPVPPSTTPPPWSMPGGK